MYDEVSYEVLNKVHDFLGILIRENLIKEAPFLDEEPMLMVSDLADDLWEVIQKGSLCNNAAKMRETLEQIDRIVWDKRRHTKEEVEAHRLATEALTPPPRNVDRFNTLQEVIAYWKEHGDEIDIPLLHWLFADMKGDNKCMTMKTKQ